MSSGRDLHRSATRTLSAAMAVIGVALVVRTVAAGGGPLSLGVLLGLLFVLAGAGRFMLAGRRR